MADYREDTRDMLKSAAVRANGTVLEAHKWFAAISEASLEHVAIDQRSVDFGWFRLNPCPYRANWKNYLLTKYPRLGLVLRYATLQRRNEIKDEIRPTMMQAIMLAVNKGLVYFSIEAVPTVRFWRVMLHSQKDRHKKMGRHGYFKYVSKTVFRMVDRSYEAYLSYLSQVSLAAGAVLTGRVFGREEYLAARIPKGKVRPDSHQPVLHPIVVPTKSTTLHGGVLDDSVNESNVSMVAANEAMLQMPAVQQEAEDMRDGSREQEASGD